MRCIGREHYHPEVTSALFAAMEDAWSHASPRFEAYRLVLPGSPSFVCQPRLCTAYCCHAYSVGMSDADVSRMARVEGLELIEFLELDEDGSPVTLPMAQPYLLSRSEGHCKLLDADLGCSKYHGRPNACRLYPHFVVFWDAQAQTARTTPSKRAAAAFEAAAKGNVFGLTPLLLGHSECPGFTGDPISNDGWAALFRTTYQLQYEAV